jgi:hypothetical protein
LEFHDKSLFAILFFLNHILKFKLFILLLFIPAILLGFALCAVRRKDNQKKLLQMFPDDDIRETIINYADGAGEENTVRCHSIIDKGIESILNAFAILFGI